MDGKSRGYRDASTYGRNKVFIAKNDTFIKRIFQPRKRALPAAASARDRKTSGRFGLA